MTAPTYVFIADEEIDNFVAGVGLPVLTQKPQLVSVQATLDALLTAAGRSGVELRFQTTGGPTTAGSAPTYLLDVIQGTNVTIDKTDPRRPVIAAAAAGGNALSTTGVKTANYTAGPNEIVPVDASGAARTVTWPTSPPDKTLETVKKIDGTPSAPGNPVTINCGGSDVFNKTGGVTSATLSLAGQAITGQYDASRSVWTVVGDDLPLSVLDARYPVLASGHVPIASAFIGAAVFIIKSGANWTDLAGNTITTRPTGAQLMISISTDGSIPSFANATDLALTVPA